jgi:tetratricopeptide (TPR) repeat protein
MIVAEYPQQKPAPEAQSLRVVCPDCSGARPAELSSSFAAYAIEDYNRSISLGSKNPQHFVNRAAALTIKGDYDLAEADFEAALRFDNKNAVALYGRGVVKNKRGGDAAGRQDMLDATKLNAMRRRLSSSRPRRTRRRTVARSPHQAESCAIAPGPGMARGGHLPRMIMPSTSSLVMSATRALPTTRPFFIAQTRSARSKTP